MKVKDAAWKRIVGGLCGVGILVGVLVLLRQRGVSGEDIQLGEEALVFGVGAGAVVLWLVKRRGRQSR